MNASLTTRLERLERALPVIDEANRIDKIVLRGLRALGPGSPNDPPPIECVLWTRPGYVEPANVS
jgi:hypothetical protein